MQDFFDAADASDAGMSARTARRRHPAAPRQQPPAVMEQLTPRAREIVASARELLEAEGAAGLSMRNLAARLGMRAPSLYKHFASKDAIEAVLISIGFDEQAQLFRGALANSREPLVAMANIYRTWGRRHPELYRLMYDRPLNRSLLIPGSEEAAAAPAIEAAGGDEDLARGAWAFAHGMTILELNNRFGEGADLDAAWARGINALQAASARGRRAPRRSIPRRAAG